MTTKTQLKKLLQPLASQRDDLFLVSPWLILKPVRHVVRGIMIDRTGDRRVFQPRWAAIYLFEKRERIPLNWGRLIYHTPGLWRWDDPDMPRDLHRAIEEEAIPRLIPLETLEGFVEHANSDDFRDCQIRLFLWRQAKIAAALGDLGEARSVCAKLSSGRTMWNVPDFAEEVELVLKDLYPLLQANDVPAITELLRSWEAISARNLGVESIWEPTPFPLELRRA